jgi:L-fuculose-phosphate aldolase
MAGRWANIRSEVFHLTMRLHQDGMLVASSGNVSARVPGEPLFAVTPTGVGYHRLQVTDIVVVDAEGTCVFGEHAPSNETPVHLAVYTARPDVACVIHSHAVYSTALSLSRTPVPPVLDEMVVHLGGGIPVARYGAPGSAELGARIVDALGEKNAVLLANHGNLIVGPDSDTAYRNAHVAERATQVYAISLATGRPIQAIPEEVIAREQQLFRKNKGRGRRPQGDGRGGDDL